MPNEPHPGVADRMTISDIYYVLFRRKAIIICCAAMGLLAAGGVFFLTPGHYRSEARLFVRYITEQTPLDPGIIGNQRIPTVPRGGSVIDTEVEILTSPALAQQVADKIGTEKLAAATPPVPSQPLLALLRRIGRRVTGQGDVSVAEAARKNPPLLVHNILRNLDVQVANNSSIIRLYFRGPTPTLAQEVLSSLIEAYLRKHVEMHRTAGALEFLSQQTDQLRARLTETEEELRTLKKDLGIASLAETRRVLVERTDELTRALQDSESALASSDARIKVLREAIPGASDIMKEGGAFQPARGSDALSDAYIRLQKLREKEIELLASFTPDSLPVRAIRDQIAAVKKTIDAEPTPTNAPLPRVTNTPTDASLLLADIANRAAIDARIKMLKVALDGVRRQSAALDTAEARIVELERRRELDETNYRQFAKSMEQARIDDALNAGKVSNISILQPPTLPVGMSRPTLSKKMGIALGMGLVMGFGLAFLLEFYLDRTLKRPTQVEAALNVPMLISIPMAAPNGRLALGQGLNRGTRLLPAHDGSTDSTGPGGAEPKTWPLRGDLRDYFEALRDRVVANVTRRPDSPHLIGITSCAKGSGVTTTASGLAVTFARNGDGRILLVDASTLDHSSGSRMFGAGSYTGLTDILTDVTGTVRIMQPNLYVLAATEVGEEIPRVSLGQGMSELIEFAKKSNYSYVVFDMPPISDTSLALRIAPLLDSILLIIEADRIQVGVAEKAQQMLQRVHANLIGTVLNKRRTYVPQWLQQEV